MTKKTNWLTIQNIMQKHLHPSNLEFVLNQYKELHRRIEKDDEGDEEGEIDKLDFAVTWANCVRHLENVM